MRTPKTSDERKLERAIGLKAIARTAEEMQQKGADAIDIRTFINGSRKKLAEVAPDPEQYSKALDLVNEYTRLVGRKR